MKNIVTKIDDLVQVKCALISVSDKSGLETFLPELIKVCPGIKILSTGGTYKSIEAILGSKIGSRLIQVSDYTGQPETQGGLVKTLDFKIYLGLLTETYNDAHRGDLKRTGAMAIDLVIVNLYPFEATIAQEAVTIEEARSNIDIGGPCMIRASAKNYLRVAPVVDPKDYKKLLGDLSKNKGATTLKLRFELARKAFEHTARYDRAISDYLHAQTPAKVRKTYPELI